jgi:hypothetical protein
MLYVQLWILIYLSIGLVIYFTIPNRKTLPIHITLPFIVAWLFIAIFFLFQPGRKNKGE